MELLSKPTTVSLIIFGYSGPKFPMGMVCIIAGFLNIAEPIGRETVRLFSPEVRKRKYYSVD
jgi:hypothetical protein